jgi:hypothetical protein
MLEQPPLCSATGPRIRDVPDVYGREYGVARFDMRTVPETPLVLDLEGMWKYISATDPLRLVSDEEEHVVNEL